MPTAVTSRRRPVFAVLDKVVPAALAGGSAFVAVSQWVASPWLLRAAFVVCVAAFAAQTVRGFSTVTVDVGEVVLTYPFVTFRYRPDQIISIEWVAVPQAIRIRPQGRRFLAHVVYMRELANAEAFGAALREFTSRHSVPSTPT